MSTGQPQFTCSACGRHYTWKPQIAGKKAACKCGGVIQIPAVAPAASVESAAPSAAPAAAEPTCPSCGAQLTEGAILCINCGYNLQTGAAFQTEVAAAEAPVAAVTAQAASPAPARKRGGTSGPFIPPESRRRAKPQQDNAGHTKQIIIVAVLALVVIGIVVGARFYMKKGNKPTGPMLGRDAEAIKMLDDQNPVEALEFVESGRMLGNQWTQSVAKGKVNNWYKAGAKKVWAFSAQISASVVIELPDKATNATGRKEIVDWVEQWDKDHFRQVQKDVGQRYLIVELM